MACLPRRPGCRRRGTATDERGRGGGGTTGANGDRKRETRAAPRGEEIEQNATDATHATRGGGRRHGRRRRVVAAQGDARKGAGGKARATGRETGRRERKEYGPSRASGTQGDTGGRDRGDAAERTWDPTYSFDKHSRISNFFFFSIVSKPCDTAAPDPYRQGENAWETSECVRRRRRSRKRTAKQQGRYQEDPNICIQPTWPAHGKQRK